ncbi:MAG: hypothetical protein ACE5FA_00370 [Dehalococcoidia bacterium]
MGFSFKGLLGKLAVAVTRIHPVLAGVVALLRQQGPNLSDAQVAWANQRLDIAETAAREALEAIQEIRTAIADKKLTVDEIAEIGDEVEDVLFPGD